MAEPRGGDCAAADRHRHAGGNDGPRPGRTIVEQRPGLKVVFMSGYSAEVLARARISSGEPGVTSSISRQRHGPSWRQCGNAWIRQNRWPRRVKPVRRNEGGLNANHTTPETKTAIMKQGMKQIPQIIKLMSKVKNANCPRARESTGRNGCSWPSAGVGVMVLPHAAVAAQAPVPLGSTATFGVLAGTTVTSTGDTVIVGDLGVSTGTT